MGKFYSFLTVISIWRLRCPRPFREYLLKRRAHDRKLDVVSDTYTSAPDPCEPRLNYFGVKKKEGRAPRESPRNRSDPGRGMNKVGGGEKRNTPPQRATLLELFLLGKRLYEDIKINFRRGTP